MSSGARYCVITSSIPSLLRPAAARTIPSNCCSSIFRSLVSTFPRIFIIWRSGLNFNNWNALLLLPVAITAPSRNSDRCFAVRRINTSLGSSLFHTFVKTRPFAGVDGMSFMLWTPIWISPEMIFSSISLTNRPFPPILSNGLFWILSPFVLMIWISKVCSG